MGYSTEHKIRQAVERAACQSMDWSPEEVQWQEPIANWLTESIDQVGFAYDLRTILDLRDRNDVVDTLLIAPDLNLNGLVQSLSKNLTTVL